MPVIRPGVLRRPLKVGESRNRRALPATLDNKSARSTPEFGSAPRGALEPKVRDSSQAVSIPLLTVGLISLAPLFESAYHGLDTERSRSLRDSVRFNELMLAMYPRRRS